MFPLSYTGMMGGVMTRESAVGKTGILYVANGYFIDAAQITRLNTSGDFTLLQYIQVISGTTLAVGYYQNNNISTDNSRIFTLSTSVVQNITLNTPTSTPTSGLIGLLFERRSGQYNIYTCNGVGGVFSLLNFSLAAFSAPAPGLVTIMLDITNKTAPNARLISLQYWEDVLSAPDRTELLENAYFLPSATRNLLYYQKTDGESDLGAYPARMTSDSAPSPYVVSASGIGAGLSAYLAFDDSLGTRTAINIGGVTANSWLRIDLSAGNEQIIDRLIIANFQTFGINSFTFQGSTDNSTWDSLLTSTCAQNALPQYYDVTNTTLYRYYRVFVNSGYNATNAQIAQVWLINKSKQWSTGGGYARDGSLTFPT